MAKVQRRIGFSEEKPQAEETVDTKLELMKYLANVQSRIKDEITTDFVYARLGDKDKSAIIEMTVNAYYGRKLLGVISKSYRRWVWNDTVKIWESRFLEDNEQKLIDLHGQNLFDTFMRRMFMIAILNRNVKAVQEAVYHTLST